MMVETYGQVCLWLPYSIASKSSIILRGTILYWIAQIYLYSTTLQGGRNRIEVNIEALALTQKVTSKLSSTRGENPQLLIVAKASCITSAIAEHTVQFYTKTHCTLINIYN